MTQASDVILTSIHCYPIKSCRGVTLERAATTAAGIGLDRRWMVVDEAGGFLTQRTDPRFATITVALEDGVALKITSARMPELQIALDLESPPDRDVVVWGDRVRARSEGATAAAWFSEFLGTRTELVFVPDPHLRRLANDPPRSHRNRVAFSDAMPVLLTNEASLSDLNRRLDVPVPMNRFRPNLVVSGAGAWAEDEWTGLRIGLRGFHGLRPCGRCVVTTTDQETGERGVEPLRTLATFRRLGERLVFGRYLVFEGEGTIAVGDPVRVTTAAHPPEFSDTA